MLTGIDKRAVTFRDAQTSHISQVVCFSISLYDTGKMSSAASCTQPPHHVTPAVSGKHIGLLIRLCVWVKIFFLALSVKLVSVLHLKIITFLVVFA